MREIKFRAWNTFISRMISWGTIVEANPTLEHMESKVHEWMQYTGRKDKNGKESYFDDVLKWRDSTFRIVWDDDCACVMLKRLTGMDGMSEIPAHNIKQGEVIGNIYENPELIRKD